MKISELPCHERPREKLVEKGSAGLKDKELLAVLLRTGYAGKNVLEVAQEILNKFPKRKLLTMSYQDMLKIKGIDSGKACALLAAFELTKRALDVEDGNLPVIAGAQAAADQLLELRSAKKEHFVVLYLNARNQLIHKETVSIGTINANLVHPREVFKPAIEYLACSIIVAHNHPSGGLEPSAADLEVTARLKEAGKLIGIEVNDHLIITQQGFLSII